MTIGFNVRDQLLRGNSASLEVYKSETNRVDTMTYNIYILIFTQQLCKVRMYIKYRV